MNKINLKSILKKLGFHYVVSYITLYFYLLISYFIGNKYIPDAVIFNKQNLLINLLELFLETFVFSLFLILFFIGIFVYYLFYRKYRKFGLIVYFILGIGPFTIWTIQSLIFSLKGDSEAFLALYINAIFLIPLILLTIINYLIMQKNG